MSVPNSINVFRLPNYVKFKNSFSTLMQGNRFQLY